MTIYAAGYLLFWLTVIFLGLGLLGGIIEVLRRTRKGPGIY